jgi:AcrR family transcriptional regulator
MPVTMITRLIIMNGNSSIDMLELRLPDMTQTPLQTKQTPKARKLANSPLQRRVREGRESLYRDAIREASERVFAEKGTDASRMREIAKEAGVSLATLYGVIDGKQSLLIAIHHDRMRAFYDCIRAARDAHDDTLASHLAVLRDGAQYFLERPDFLRMCCRDGYGWASGLPAPSGGVDLWEEGTSIPRDLFVRGIAEGIYVDEDSDLLVRKMLALKQVELTHWVHRGMTVPHDQIFDRLESQFVRAFCLPT